MEKGDEGQEGIVKCRHSYLQVSLHVFMDMFNYLVCNVLHFENILRVFKLISYKSELHKCAF